MTGTPHAKKSLFISFTMIMLAYLTGTVTILNYITYIFKQTGSALTEKHSSVLVSITQLTGNLVFMNIVERFNRRVCMAILMVKSCSLELIVSQCKKKIKDQMVLMHTFSLSLYWIYRHFTFVRRLQRQFYFSHLVRMAISKWKVSDMNGFHLFVCRWQYFPAVWDCCQYHMLLPRKYFPKRYMCEHGYELRDCKFIHLF